jgi:hypothetical protein
MPAWVLSLERVAFLVDVVGIQLPQVGIRGLELLQLVKVPRLESHHLPRRPRLVTGRGRVDHLIMLYGSWFL